MLNVCIVGSANIPSKLAMAKSKIVGYSYCAKLQSKKQQPGIFQGQFLRVQENHHDKYLIRKGVFDQLSVTIHKRLEIWEIPSNTNPLMIMDVEWTIIPENPKFKNLWNPLCCLWFNTINRFARVGYSTENPSCKIFQNKTSISLLTILTQSNLYTSQSSHHYFTTRDLFPKSMQDDTYCTGIPKDIFA